MKYELDREQDMVEVRFNPKPIAITIVPNTGGNVLELKVDNEGDSGFISEEELSKKHDGNNLAASREFLATKNAGVCVGSGAFLNKHRRDTPPHGHMKLTKKEAQALSRKRSKQLKEDEEKFSNYMRPVYPAVEEHKDWPEYYKVSMMEARDIMAKRSKKK